MTDFDIRMQSLAERAKEANERVQASAGETKEALQSRVSTARASIAEALAAIDFAYYAVEEAEYEARRLLLGFGLREGGVES